MPFIICLLAFAALCVGLDYCAREWYVIKDIPHLWDFVHMGISKYRLWDGQRWRIVDCIDCDGEMKWNDGLSCWQYFHEEYRTRWQVYGKWRCLYPSWAKSILVCPYPKGFGKMWYEEEI